MKSNSEKNFKDYYIGLDMGTDSCGWAVTDVNYKLLRINNKNLWGVRLFEGAETAKDRRTFRASRRRLQRRKLRLQLLEELFAPCINEIDPNFFARLADSNLYEEDKRENTWFSLFADDDFNDRDFHRKYKTVYHLRKAMAEEENPDPRLVFLALHHIIKNRGHFLIEGGIEAVDDISQPFEAINAYLFDRDYTQLQKSAMEDFRQMLVSLKGNKSVRAKRYAECLGVNGDKKLSALLKLVAGLNVKLKDLPIDIDEKSENSDESITFDTDWEKEEAKFRDILQDDYVLIENAKLLYDYAQLKKLLGESKTFSEAMVGKYEKHRQDLALLKKVMRKYFDRDAYDEMFKTPPKGKCNYTAYCGKTKFGSKGTRIQIDKNHTSYDDFAKYVREVLSSNALALQDDDVKQILEELGNGTFLPKQVSKNNSTIPYQLNEKELVAILEHVRRYPRFAFLNTRDEDGTDNAEKIRRILVYRIPYFVGPVNNHSGKYWIVRKSGGRILPWNYEQKIDLDKTEEGFIENLTRYCTYLRNEKVLPKCSLLYEEYNFLNIVCKIKINGEPISPEQKAMLSDFFAQYGTSKLTSKFLKKWLADNNFISSADEVVLEGFDEGVSVSRRTYYQFTKILGSRELVEKYRDKIEQIIFDVTVGASEKSRLRKRLEKYEFLTEGQRKQIVGLTCVGWGRLSEKFLTSRVGINPSTGEVNAFSIIDALRSTTDNLMQVYNKYGFKEYFERDIENLKFGYDIVDGLYCSPAVKKQIWQALCLVKEIRSVLGSDPKKIFVEVAREKNPDKDKKEERNRTKSRLQTLREKLDFENSALSAEVRQNVKDRFAEAESNPRRLNETKLFLYFLQNGIDIYTGEPIDYNNFSLYDKDHIYPRSKIKDDSLDNLVLTYRPRNAEKTDDYPVKAEIRTKMRPVWEALRKQGLMSEEKFRRLTRDTPLTDKEMTDFIQRQLVETRQSTKETIKLLKSLFPDTEVVFSKAALVSEFRAKQRDELVVDPVTGKEEKVRRAGFIKCREVNDLHHAKDAYLNIVVGNVYNTRYGHNAQFMRNGTDRGGSDAKIYEHNIGSGANAAWVADENGTGENGTMAQVIKTMRGNTPLYTFESYVKTGLFEKTSMLPKSDEGNLIPLKSPTNPDERLRKMSDTSKYGGYNNESRSYFMLVKYTEEKQKTKYRLLGVVARFAGTLVDDSSRVEYCRACGLIDPQILISKIKIGAFFRFGETMLALSGVTGNNIIWRLAQQNRQSDETTRYLKKVCEVAERWNKCKSQNEPFVPDDHDGVDRGHNLWLYDTLVSTLESPRYSGAQSMKSFPMRTFASKCRKKAEKFGNLGLGEQCVVLGEIGKALQCNALTSDLSLLDEGAHCGIISIRNTFESLDGIYIVHRSVTGIFEQQIPLSDLDKTR